MSLTEIHRHPDWEDRLSNYFAIVEENPFAWGDFDAVLFASSAVQRMTDTDVLAAVRGQYSDRAGLARALRERGAGTLQQTLTALLGKPRHAALARRGDIIIADGALGICVGKFSRFSGGVDEQGQLVLDGTAGRSSVIAVPTLSCLRAWAVPF